MSNPVPYNERTQHAPLDTTLLNYKDQGHSTPLAITITPPGDSGTAAPTAAPTEHTQLELPISPLSLSSPILSITSPEDDHTQPQRRRRDMNRVAAARCRKKAKKRSDELQELGQNLFRTNKILHIEVKDLREEVLSLKKDILVHGRCDSAVIQRYIQGAAERAGQGTRDSRGESGTTRPTP